ncbi:mechanosensitive ion channel family protein [Alkalibacterium iburiense]|uniref:Mechanosensitive ion channel family protein n=1 Tax=Alkalibacterium iburiense TaxID=290589 RepID=A0ABP3GUF3_9LACT
MDNRPETIDNIGDGIGEDLGAFEEFWNAIDWNALAASVIIGALKILLAVILFFVVKKIGNVVIESVFKRYMKNKNTVPNRLNTLYKLAKNIFHSILYFFLVYSILEIIGIPVGTLVASAGVIGLALSLGAQGFVSDIVNGFMILLEKQLDVGDVVTVGDVTGTVEDVNLKTTKLKDFDGTVHFIPNRVIEVISNQSRSDMRVLILLRLYPSTNLDKVREVLEQVNAELIPNQSDITAEPTGVSFVPVGSGQMAAQVIMYTKAGSQWGVRNLFFEEYVEALSQNGIELPEINLDLTGQ